METLTKIYENVIQGKNTKIGLFTIIGLPIDVSSEEKTVLGNDVSIGNQTIIYQGVCIENNVKIGDNCIIGPNVKIKKHSVIESLARIENSEIGVSNRIGSHVSLGVLPEKKYDYQDKLGSTETILVSGENCNIKSHCSLYAGTKIGTLCSYAA